MPSWPEVAGAGAVIGVLFGLFGVGGSSVATPVLALIGVPGLVAVATPLPAVIPSAVAGLVTYVRRGEVEWPVARWSISGGLPGTVVGALASKVVGGRWLLAASGVVLALVGVRMLAPLAEDRFAGRDRRRAGLVVPAALVIGVFTGMLANGGGFLLVPLFVVVLGLTMPESAGTSMVVVAFLSVPTMITHWALGHIDWSVAAAFAAGSIPGATVGSRLAQHLSAGVIKRVFAVLVIGFGTYFAVRQLVAGG